MLSSVSKLPGKYYRRENITLLVASPDGSDFEQLRQIFRHEDWNIERAYTCQDAIRFMEQSKPSVVLCSSDFGDAAWKRLLQHSLNSEVAPMVVVVSSEPDNNLWAEVLNLGGYDVLLKPFEKTEVIRVVGMAWRHWKECAQRRNAPAISSLPALCH